MLDVRLEIADPVDQVFRAINVLVIEMESLIATLSQGKNFFKPIMIFFSLTQSILYYIIVLNMWSS